MPAKVDNDEGGHWHKQKETSAAREGILVAGRVGAAGARVGLRTQLHHPVRRPRRHALHTHARAQRKKKKEGERMASQNNECISSFHILLLHVMSTPNCDTHFITSFACAAF